ncbi:MAG: NADPH-dependent FMN reductase [Pseudomonadota bacterium]
MSILAFCGSLRRVSMNAVLLRATVRLAPAALSVEIFPGLAALPLFNPDLEAELPPAVCQMHAAVAECDALLIASPEYAHGVTGVLKNALDWLVSFEGFIDKRVAIFNASPRSVHADASLREILATMSANIVAGACLALPLRGLNLTEQQMFDSQHAAAIRQALLTLAPQEARA